MASVDGAGDGAASRSSRSGASHGGFSPTDMAAPPTQPIQIVGGPKTVALLIGALGVVFGDIGTSPLYTMRTVMTAHGTMSVDQQTVFGIISMITWCLLIIVTGVYVGVITRADNQGEGGILSLAALVQRKVGVKTRTAAVALMIAVIGAALFLGDSLITPAISVLSAVEGLSTVNSGLADWVVPMAVVVLTVLFAVQRRGTGGIGRVFGPFMAFWFLMLGAMGLPWIIAHPGVLLALSPSFAVEFAAAHPWIAFVALGSCVLAITGAEALYADLGHFGRRPIKLAWLTLILPTLLLNYLGQGAMLLERPSAIANPFFELAPAWSRIPLVIAATLATVIASQAVISGAFSVIRQGIRLSLLPRIKVVQTSEQHGGQIYLPAVNAMLFCGVLLLVVAFGSSERLASAYGFAVTGTLLLELSLFLMFAHRVWHWRWRWILLTAVVAGGLELLLFSANILKIVSGGWLPLSVAAVIAVVMITWKRGSRIMFGRRRELEGSIDEFIEEIRSQPPRRVPGVAVYPHGDVTTVPLALRATCSFMHALHEHVVIITVKNVGVPHVRTPDRVIVNSLGHADDGIVHVLYRVGFNDSQDVPGALRLAVGRSRELRFAPADALYVLSVFRIEPAGPGEQTPWPGWQRHLFRVLERMSANRTQVFHLPQERTIVMGAEVSV